MKYSRVLVGIFLTLILTGCVGAVVGVAVDTTAAVVKAPFQLTGAVVGVAADTTGAVIAAPFRMANAAVGGSRHDGHERHDRHQHSDRRADQHDEQHEYKYVYSSGEHRDGNER